MLAKLILYSLLTQFNLHPLKRWFELVRLEKVSEVRAETWNGSLFQSNNHYYFPIPYQQIRLTQWTNNAGY